MLAQFRFLQQLINDKVTNSRDYSKISLLDFIVDTHKKLYNEDFIVKSFHYEICELLTHCAKGTLPDGKYIVIINMPFRFSKTQILTYFMIWCFLNNEHAKFIYSSYSDKLSLRTSREVKNALVEIFDR